MQFHYEITADDYVACQLLHWKLTLGRKRTERILTWFFFVFPYSALDRAIERSVGRPSWFLLSEHSASFPDLLLSFRDGIFVVHTAMRIWIAKDS